MATGNIFAFKIAAKALQTDMVTIDSGQPMETSHRPIQRYDRRPLTITI